MSPISATRVIAVSLPIPGRAMSAWTRGSGLASPVISPSSRPIGVARASSSPQQSWMIARGIGGRQGQPASPVRAPSTGRSVQRCLGRPARRGPGSSGRCSAGPGWPDGAAAPADPWSPGARSRPRATARPVAVGPGWPHPPCRSCSRAEAMALPRLGWTRCGSSSSSSNSSTSQPQPSAASKATGVPGGNAPRIGASWAGSLARVRLRCWVPAASPMATWERLRCTSMPTYTPIRASFPELELLPKPRLSG
jgi:hypothetical protein